jgi:hypothetical protein
MGLRPNSHLPNRVKVENVSVNPERSQRPARPQWSMVAFCKNHDDTMIQYCGTVKETIFLKWLSLLQHGQRRRVENFVPAGHALRTVSREPTVCRQFLLPEDDVVIAVTRVISPSSASRIMI